MVEEAAGDRSPLPNEAAEFLVQLGSALVASGAPVDFVEGRLHELSSRYGLQFGYSILPTGLIALGRDGSSTVASIATSDPATYRFDQISALFDLLDDTRSGYVDPRDGLNRLASVSRLHPHFGPVVTLAGHVVLTVGLALLLGPSEKTLGIVALLGGGVAGLKHLVTGRPTLARLLPALAAFLVALAVFSLQQRGAQIDGLKAIIPPLVTFLPGAMLTVAAVELTSGSIVAGTSRLTAGALQLLLLALGFVAALSVTGANAETSLADAPGSHISWWGPWIGVALFGLGSAVYFSASVRSYPALIVVLYAAYLGQHLTAGIVGSYFSGTIGALVAVVSASALRRRAHGPPVLVTFLPAFWLLVPGVLSLVGVTRLTAGQAALSDIAIAFLTVLAVALGVVAGLGVERTMTNRYRWW